MTKVDVQYVDNYGETVSGVPKPGETRIAIYQTNVSAIDMVESQLDELAKRVGLLRTMSYISNTTGGHVKFHEEYGYIPILIGNDNRPVLLLRLVEILDGLIDYEMLQSELPTLSLSQIDGAIQFIRKLSQINSRGIDLDDLEDEEDMQDDELMVALRASLANQEIARVLFDDNRTR